MFEIIDTQFKTDNYGTDTHLYNWPMLYILENGKKAYVGQTNSIVSRMAQHKANPEKDIFTTAHFIFYDKSNQSATFDYESRLIRFMAADNKFILTNKNAGVIGDEYYKKDDYSQDFNNLWRELQKKGLVEKSIEELEQSDLFKYSPYKELSSDQRNLVEELTESLKRKLERKIVIKGMPGSGKTVLGIYLFKLLRELPEFRDLEIGMVVPPTSLRNTLRKVFSSINGLSAKDVIGPSDVANKKYDILMVDESHRLKSRKNLSSYRFFDDVCEKLGLENTCTQLDWILKQSKCAILFYDKNQVVFPAGLKIEELINKDPYDTRSTSSYILESQMRCLGGIDYLQDINKLLHSELKQKVRHSNYELMMVNNFVDFEKLFREKEKNFGLTRMLAGYAWEWKSKCDKNLIDIEIDGVKKQWNSTLENWVHSENAINEIGCIHSSQGYDLNYGFVIIGEDLKYNPVSKRVYIDKTSYFDKYGKFGSTDEELDEYIKNIYYVLMTRGIKGTYIYVCNPELRKYMASFIEEYSAKSEIHYKYGQSSEMELMVAEDAPKYGL